MTTATSTATPTATSGMGFLRRTEAWLDNGGRKAWILSMVLGFVFFWPLGLALLFYITVTNRWSKTAMFARTPACAASRGAHWSAMRAARPSGNTAFDAYKAETLRRLEEEQAAFESFLQRLREAKDKSEFDTFMDERARAARGPAVVDPTEVARPGEY